MMRLQDNRHVNGISSQNIVLENICKFTNLGVVNILGRNRNFLRSVANTNLGRFKRQQQKHHHQSEFLAGRLQPVATKCQSAKPRHISPKSPSDKGPKMTKKTPGIKLIPFNWPVPKSWPQESISFFLARKVVC